MQIFLLRSDVTSVFWRQFPAGEKSSMGFASRSLLLLFALYGLVFAIGDAYLLHGQAPIWWGIAFVVVLIGVQYLLAPWLIEFCFSIDWDEDAVPEAQRAFVERMCKEHNLPPLRIGIIESGTPNAFAFGRLRSDARIVVTRGLLDVLTEDEANAVLAHEIGHVAHYDFAVMALAALAPLLLYQLYAWSNRVSHLRPLAYSAYLAYWVGRFMVLMLNRTREYGADHFSAQVTRAPGNLASALVKIGYGMVRETSEARRIAKSDAKTSRKSLQLGSTLALMGIASASHGEALALGASSPDDAARVMRWDLVNPWARFYELGSTHPLTAMRLRSLNREAKTYGQNVTYSLPLDERVRWTGFPLEFLFWVAPLVCGFLLFTWGWLGRDLRNRGFVLPEHSIAWLLIALGITWGARIAFRYRGNFQRKHVNELLEDLNVSQMRPLAVEVEGEVVGHGIPGAFWSPDLVLRDETGLIFLLYRSSVPFGRLLFALRSADRLVGERVTVKGWYRRGLKPYIEMSRVEARVSKASGENDTLSLFGKEGISAPLEYEQIVERSYSRWIQLAASAACAAAGILWLLGTLAF
jgi:heat shock protein HtpX